MSCQVLASYTLGKIQVCYMQCMHAENVGMRLLPLSHVNLTQNRRATLAGEPEIDLLPEAAPNVSVLDPLVHVKLIGEEYCGGFSQGHTMRGAPGNDLFKLKNHHARQEDDMIEIVTVLINPQAVELEHRLRWQQGWEAIEVDCSVTNHSQGAIQLEHVSSFSFGDITPFDQADAPGRLQVHRFRSGWSAEGRLETRSIEQLHLERSWSGASKFSERFGQVGSMPVRQWFPFVAIEDIQTKVIWAAQLQWAGSWQLEVFRQHDDVCLSGGLADREFGHWTKTLQPGERMDTPSAWLTCLQGDIDEACDALTAMQHHALANVPEVEHDLPIVFNEWCTTWGDPTHDRMVKLADRLEGTGVRYQVIDAGWYKTQTDADDDWGGWSNGHGDWIPNQGMFPNGLKATADAIRQRGLIPGLWFEMETVGCASNSYQTRLDCLLHRDGQPLTSRQRRFWDLSNPDAVAFLTEHVIDLLEKGNFGYFKIDYNETIGIGSDHVDGQGEGLRQQILGVYRLIDLIRQRLPNLVIENCSSGGHRLEPSMIGRTAMSSFSDAHETRQIPIIAANLQRLMLPRQSQVWAVLHAQDDLNRLTYSLAATFLGRMCLSGDVDELPEWQWRLVCQAIDLYQSIKEVIADGTSRRVGSIGESWQHPTGWQAVIRQNASCDRALIVWHTFTQAPDGLRVALPQGQWKIDRVLGSDDATQPDVEVDSSHLMIQRTQSWQGGVVVLKRVW